MRKIFVLMFIIFTSIQLSGFEWYLTHQITSTSTFYIDQSNLDTDLNYKPTLVFDLIQSDDHYLDSEISYDFNLKLVRINNHGKHQNNEFKITGDLYRSWLRYSTSQSEIRIGLQKINFGPAQILRSLQWFDNIDPNDPTQMTEGVKALLGRYYFINNANIWLWGIWGDRNDTSFEKFFYEEDNLEFGGRIQYPFQYCEAGFSAHHSPTDTQTFNTETKYGIDLRWDMALGFWIESCLNVYSNSQQNNYSRQLTLGTDYTFGIGNGIYSLLEHQYFSEVQEDIWNPSDRTGASSLLISYPLGMFDSVRSILTYNWQPELYNWFLSYNRNYDFLSLYINCFGNIDKINDDKSIQLIIEKKF